MGGSEVSMKRRRKPIEFRQAKSSRGLGCKPRKSTKSEPLGTTRDLRVDLEKWIDELARARAWGTTRIEMGDDE